jgi:methionyl-tRNA synthetase
MSDQRFYITTPIYYPNGEPHLGHFYTTACADVVARYHRLAGDDVWFLTGTDEHGIKMVKTAEAAGTTPAALADQNAAVFQAITREFNFSNDDFIRTSEPRHKLAVQEIVRRMLATGDIYLGSYEGWYDEGQEEFITESAAKEQEYKSAISGRPLVRYQESTYFFKLSKYVDRVYAAIEADEVKIRPVSRKNEVLSKLKGWTQDLSISRATLKWGIEMPNDPGHVLYVWIDALSNYITALGYPNGDAKRFEKFWPVDVHLIGREILWFHAVYWPAMLLSLGLPLPRQLYAHGWWTAEGKKMSKSLGNFIDLAKLREYAAKYTNDGLRYYMLQAAPFGNDLNFTEADFNKAYGELGRVLGNCLNRVINMIAKYRTGQVPAATTAGADEARVVEAKNALGAKLAEAYGELRLQDAVTLPIELAREVNVYIDQRKPFTLAKDPAKAAELDTVLNVMANGIRAALVGLLPVLPKKAAEGLAQLNVAWEGKPLAALLAEDFAPGHQLGTATPLFPSLDPPKAG